MTPSRLQRALSQQLKSYQGAGVTHVASSSEKLGKSEPTDASQSPPRDTPSEESTAPPPSIQDTRTAMPRTNAWQIPTQETLFDADDSPPQSVSKAPTLEALYEEVAKCTLCPELVGNRTQTVPGVGNPRARLCFFGEAPGADEDRLGEPFVGRAGQLLNKIIEACKMKREDVYITNVLKCRPPGNRNPLPEEADNCSRYYLRQFDLIQPEFICCLGAVAAQHLLQTTQSIGRLRGKVHTFRGAKVVCTYHPAYLLRNPAAKKDTWEDMKLLMHEMGVEL